METFRFSNVLHRGQIWATGCQEAAIKALTGLLDLRKIPKSLRGLEYGQNGIICSLSHGPHFLKISSKSDDNFSIYFAKKQTPANTYLEVIIL